MKQEVLIESLSPGEANVLTKNEGKNCFLSGVFMQADIKNRNGRNYPLSEISRAVESARGMIKESNGIFGELDHPQTLQINLERISHVITDLGMNGSNAVGKAKILDTPMGSIARSLVESGVRLGVSSRGAGQVGADGAVSDFSFVTVDIVAQPSAPGATPTSIYESLMNDPSGEKSVTLAEQMRHDEAAQKYFQVEIAKFIENVIKKL